MAGLAWRLLIAKDLLLPISNFLTGSTIGRFLTLAHELSGSRGTMLETGLLLALVIGTTSLAGHKAQ
jgi:hypothetical protein